MRLLLLLLLLWLHWQRGWMQLLLRRPRLRWWLRRGRKLMLLLLWLCWLWRRGWMLLLRRRLQLWWRWRGWMLQRLRVWLHWWRRREWLLVMVLLWWPCMVVGRRWWMVLLNARRCGLARPCRWCKESRCGSPTRLNWKGPGMLLLQLRLRRGVGGLRLNAWRCWLRLRLDGDRWRTGGHLCPCGHGCWFSPCTVGNTPQGEGHRCMGRRQHDPG
jgi:hypothetical protein